MKKTLGILFGILFVLALLIGGALVALRSTGQTVTITEVEAEPMVTLPTPTPEPAEPVIWEPRADAEFDALFFNANYTLGVDTNNACDGGPDELADVSFENGRVPEWVTETYPDGMQLNCRTYVAWQFCQEAEDAEMCETTIINAMGGRFISAEYFEAQVEAAISSTDDTVYPEPTAIPTETVITETESVSNTVTLLDGMVTLTGFPEEAETVRWGFDLGRDENDCGFAPLAWLVCDPGVFSFDYPDDETVENKIQDDPSGVWTGGANVDIDMTTPIHQVLMPGNGYLKVNWAGGWIRYGNVSIYMEPTENVSFMFLERGVYAEEGGNQTPVEFEFASEEYVGAGKAMRYPIVDPNASGFFSWFDFHKDVLNQLNADNCVFDGCGMVVIFGGDVNRGNATVATYTAADGYTMIYSNSRSE